MTKSDTISKMSSEERKLLAEARYNALESLFRSRYGEKNMTTLRNVPHSKRRGYIEALTGKSTPRNAIKAKCLECSTWQVEEVTHCAVRLCPLYEYRPYQKTE